MADWAETNADDLRLDLYIAPELEFNRARPNEEERWELVRAVRESQLQEALREVFHDTERKHLLVMDEAGAGKTITSLRIQKLLSGKESSQEIFPDSQRRIVVHWSGGIPATKSGHPRLPQLLKAWVATLEDDWDEKRDNHKWRDFKEQLLASLAYAREQGRLILIVDAWDEFSQADREKLKRVFQATSNRVRWIFTARDYAVKDTLALAGKDKLFEPLQFRQLRLKPFTEELQNEYMQRALGAVAWRTWLQGPKEGWEELLELPYVFREIVRYVAETGTNNPVWSSPSDLFVQFAREMIVRELMKSANQAVLEKLNQWLQERVDAVNEWAAHIERAMGCVALEMACREKWPKVIGDEVSNRKNGIWANAKRRFLASCKSAGVSDEDAEKLWQWAKNFVRESQLHKGATQGDLREESIAFRNRRVLEMWAARYCTKYATEQDLRPVAGSDLVTVRYCLGKTSWFDVWRAAIRMPLRSEEKKHGADRETYLNCLKVLFERPLRETNRRPTDLMWIAEQWLRGTRESEMVDELHVHLQDQFEQMQQHGNDEQKEAIVELLNPERYVFLRCSKDASNGDTGQFLMGPDEDDNNRTVEVTLSPFAMCKYQLTRKQARIWDEGFNGNDEVAAADLSWEDCYFFMRMLGKQSVSSPSGAPYYFTLPTEAQWEYACRAGSKDDYCFGNNVAELKEYAWYRVGTGWLTGEPDPQPVGEKLENKWGLYDMHGNVWEWCWDWWGEYPKDPQKDPTGRSLGSYRVDRGGSWYNGAARCRSAFRGWDRPWYRRGSGGFRVALSSSGIPEQAEPGRVD
jgi:hypothetical protein